jgi:hypothetical protein
MTARYAAVGIFVFLLLGGLMLYGYFRPSSWFACSFGPYFRLRIGARDTRSAFAILAAVHFFIAAWILVFGIVRKTLP